MHTETIETMPTEDLHDWREELCRRIVFAPEREAIVGLAQANPMRVEAERIMALIGEAFDAVEAELQRRAG